MKIFSLACLLFVAACSNPKIRIVEQQKAIKDSIVSKKKQADRFLYVSSDTTQPKVDFTGTSTPRYYEPHYKELAIIDMEIKQLEKRYDSLEMELKKY